MIDERKICLGDILTVDLNFGDNWHRVVHVEEVLPLDQPNSAGCYQDCLELLDEEPDCEEITSFQQWACEDFDPDRFDRHAANAALRCNPSAVYTNIRTGPTYPIASPRCRPSSQDTPLMRVTAVTVCPRCCSITGFHGTRLNPIPSSSIA